MPSRTDEDLFAHTTMTFGEHLEELRKALFLSLIGLVLGFLIGLLFGNYIVEFIQSPLRNALVEFYETGAEKTHAADPVALEFIENEGMISETRYVMTDRLIESLRRDYPDKFTGLPLPKNAPGHPLTLLGPTQFLPADLIDAKDFCKKLAAGKSSEAGSVSRVWSLLTKEQQTLVENYVKQKQLGEDEETRICEVLNSLVRQADLYSASDFPPSKLQGASRELAERRDDLTTLKLRRLNRLLLETAFPDTLARSYPAAVPIVLWQITEESEAINPISTGVPDSFLIYLKASLLFGVVISSPWIFYQIWSFVGAGLYPHEKRYVHIFLPFSITLFLAGAALAFFFVIELVLSFLFGFNARLGINATPRITEWLNFVLLLPVGFGIAFQLPLVMLFLERIGIFNVQSYVEKWRIAVLVIALVSMLLTPADPGSMILMGLPLVVLYAFGIVLCRYMPRGRSPFDEEAG